MNDKIAIILLVQLFGLFWGTSVFKHFELDTAQKVKVTFLTIVPTLLLLILWSKGELHGTF